MPLNVQGRFFFCQHKVAFTRTCIKLGVCWFCLKWIALHSFTARLLMQILWPHRVHSSFLITFMLTKKGSNSINDLQGWHNLLDGTHCKAKVCLPIYSVNIHPSAPCLWFISIWSLYARLMLKGVYPRWLVCFVECTSWDWYYHGL